MIFIRYLIKYFLLILFVLTLTFSLFGFFFGEVSFSLSMLFFSMVLLWGVRKVSSVVHCSWCGSKRVYLSRSSVSKWMWKYRNKDESQDSRAKDNYQTAAFLGYWKCNKCGALTKSQHQLSVSPKGRDEILTLELIESGEGERKAKNYSVPNLYAVSGENRKNSGRA